MSLLAATRRLLPPLSARGICTTGCFASHSALRKAPESPPRHAHMHAPNSLHVMRALVKDSPRPGLISTSVALPRVGPDDVMIKIRRTSLCGTDLQIYNWSPWSSRTVPTPLVIGHEYVGEVARVGGNVTGLEIGARVTGEGHITCGVCRNCRAGRRHLCCDTLGVGINRDGAFGEYLVIPHSNVFPLSDFISDETAAIMVRGIPLISCERFRATFSCLLKSMSLLFCLCSDSEAAAALMFSMPNCAARGIRCSRIVGPAWECCA